MGRQLLHVNAGTSSVFPRDDDDDTTIPMSTTSVGRECPSNRPTCGHEMAVVGCLMSLSTPKQRCHGMGGMMLCRHCCLQ